MSESASNPMSEAALIAYGFKEYPTSRHDQHERNWQGWARERISEDQRVRAFAIQVRFWRHSQFSTPEFEVPDGWDAWAQFNNAGNCFEVKLLGCRDKTPAKVVEFFVGVFLRMGCTAYGLANGDDS